VIITFLHLYIGLKQLCGTGTIDNFLCSKDVLNVLGHSNLKRPHMNRLSYDFGRGLFPF